MMIERVEDLLTVSCAATNLLISPTYSKLFQIKCNSNKTNKQKKINSQPIRKTMKGLSLQLIPNHQLQSKQIYRGCLLFQCLTDNITPTMECIQEICSREWGSNKGKYLQAISRNHMEIKMANNMNKVLILKAQTTQRDIQ